MSRRLHPVLMFLVASLVPLLALQAQQPPPTAQPNQPTAKDVIKAIEKKEEAAKPSNDPIVRIKEEAAKRSQVMATLSYLTDAIGPRLTGSPELKRANEWTRQKLAGWGLENAHLEPWGPFGKGWTLQRFSAQVVEPQCIPLIAYPKAWSPGTDGPVVGEVVYLDAKTESDLARFRGKLKGAIVLTAPPRNLSARFEPLGTRLSDGELLALANAPEPSPRGTGRRPTRKAEATREGAGAARDQADSPKAKAKAADPARAADDFARKKLQFLIEEGAALLVDPSPRGDGGTLFLASASVPGPAPAGPEGRRVSAWDKDAPRTLPQIVMATELYNRLVRMIGLGETLKIAVDLKVEFHDADLMAYNTIAEIPGTDLKNEVVMLGGHMDSWHSGTGATDNAAGISVAMEAVRILKRLDLKPRRTIRIALWTGEEQGLRGSRAYVSKHFGNGDDPAGTGRASSSASSSSSSTSSTEKKEPAETRPNPEHEAFSAYFNLDNGTGKVRGVYLQGNEAVRPLFARWLQPFREMGAATLSLANTGGTDHLSFDALGLPGFQFIQDPIEYDSRTHHSNQDVYDRIQADDMKQASAIMAAFVYNAAMRDEKLPRKPRPRPAATTTAGAEAKAKAEATPRVTAARGTPEQRPADLIVRNGKVLTVDPRFSTAQAVAVRDGVFAVVGTDADAARLQGETTRVIDARGRVVIPGLIESHVHATGAARGEAVQPFVQLGSIAEIQQWVRERAATAPEGAWIRIPRADLTRIRERRLPTRAELDAAGTDRPVVFNWQYASRQVQVLNTAALRAAGITRDTPDPPGGKVVKGPDGEPTGVLEDPGRLTAKHLPATPVSEARYLDELQRLLHQYNRIGITSISERNSNAEGYRAYRTLKQQGRLTARVNVTIGLRSDGTVEGTEKVIRALPLRFGEGDDWVRVGPLKIGVDGGVLYGTAYLREPYGERAAPLYGLTDPEYRGSLSLTPQKVAAMIRAGHRLGWQMCSHVTGDAGVDIVLDAVEAADRERPIKDRRYTLIHAYFPNPDAVRRAAALGVCVDTQPAWFYKDGDALATALGESRLEHFIGLADWLRGGVNVAINSDHMMGVDPNTSLNPYNPFLAMGTAVTRKTESGQVLGPDQRVSRQDALRMMTVLAAYQSFDEERKGSIEVGKLADLAILSDDLLTCEADRIKEIQVVATVVGGQVVHEAPTQP